MPTVPEPAVAGAVPAGTDVADAVPPPQGGATAPAADTDGRGRARRLRGLRGLRRPGRDVLAAGGVAVGFQAVLTVIGAVTDRVLTSSQPPSSPVSLLHHMDHWDALWYTGIPDSYQTRPQAPAFYPLFPLLVHALQVGSFYTLSTLAAGLVVNTLGVWAGVLGLVRASRSLLGSPGAGWLGVAVLLAVPPAFFLHVFYTEAVFVGLGFSAYALALRRDWEGMGLCLIPLTATRVTSVLFLGLCFLEFWRSRGWRPRGLLTPLVLWFPASLLGFAGYAAYLAVVTGRPFAMFSAYHAGPDWWYVRFDPDIVATVGHHVGVAVQALRGDAPTSVHTVVDDVLPLLALTVLVVASVYLVLTLRGAGVPLALFGLASLVMFTITSNLLSVYRYVLPCISVYLAVEVLVSRHPAARRVVPALLYPAILVQGALFVLFAANQFVG